MAGPAAAGARPRRSGALRWLAGAALALAGAAALAADPQITQFTDRPDPVPAGGNVTYTARIDNGTIDAATGVRVTVPVPSGTTFVSATAPCAPAGAAVMCDLGTVGGSGSDVRVLDFVFRAIGPGTTTVSATATLDAGNDTNAGNNVQSQTTTVVEGSDLSLAKTDAPDPVVGGANVTYTLTPANAGPNAARAIVLTDRLPPSASFVSASGAGWSCSHAGGVVTCAHPGPHAPGAAIAPVSIVARIDATGGSVTNSASVAPGEGGTADPDLGNNAATADTAVLPGADASIARKVVVAGSPASAGGSVTFRIEPRNAGPVAATDAVVTDTLPAGWSVVSVAGPNWSCGVTGATARCTRATLPAGAADDITLVATAPPAAAVGPTGTTYTNTAAIATGSTDPAPGNNAASVQVAVLPDGADLRIAMSKTPTRVARGAEATAALRVTNNGPRAATGRLRVVDQLAAGEAYVSSTGTDWSCTPNGRTVVCDYLNTGGLAVGATAPVLAVVSQVTATGALLNTACTGGTVPAGAAAGTTASPPAEGDYNAGNDCTTVLSTGTAGGPDLAITKTTSTPAGGDRLVSINEASVTYTLRVTNATAPPGVDGASGVRITDTVPGAVAGTAIAPPVATVSAGSTATFACNVASATVTCTQSGGVLLPGATVTVPITVGRPLAAGTFTNTATVNNTVEGDSNAGNDSASDTVTIEGIADIELTGKTVSPPAVRAGERATYVVSYRNNGPSDAASVTLSDTFAFPAGDPGFTVVSIASSKPGSTCGIAAGAQLTPAAPGYTCSLGGLAGGETQTVTLVVSPNFQTGNPTRNVVNTAALATVTPESPGGGDNGNNRRSVALEVDPARVDLLANKVDLQDPVPFAGNAVLDYRVTVTSNTAASATGVRISETMTPPAGKRVRFVCDTTGPASAACNAPSLCTATGVTSAPGAPVSFSCVLPAGTAATGAAQGSLAPRQSKTVFLRFEAIDTPAPTGDTYRNVATAVANEPDIFPGNDTADEQTSVRQRIDLAVAKTASAAAVAMRQPFTWTVRVTNNGPGNSVQTDLADTLPAGAVLTGPVAWTKTAPAGTGNCTAAAGAVSCALGRLDAGGVATISLPVRFEAFPAGGSATNTAVVDTDMTKIGGADPVPGNDSATSSVTVTRSSLAGTVFDDRDRAGGNAGTPQPGEPRIAGVAVRLAGTDAYGNAVDLTTTTDAAGAYAFADLAPSDGAGYTVTAAQPAGFGNSPAAPPSPGAGGSYAAAAPGGGSAFTGVVLGAAVAATGYDFPELRQASLGGSVYIDRNANGVRDAGTDDAVAGATVRLLDAATGALVAGTTTDAAGAYLFAGLDAARAYTLEQPLPASPAGLQNGPVNPGRVGGAPCAAGCTAQPDTPVPGTDRIAAIDLAAGDGTGFDFGERQRAAVAGIVYVDADRDNALGGADTRRIAGVTVRLVQGADCTSGTTLQTQATGADGAYRFDGVAALQDYLVCQTQPAGYGNGNARGTPGSNSIALASLPAAGSLDNHFGETVGALAGAVYQDNGAGTPANAGNGARDAGEAGIAGVTITLTGRDIAGAAVNLSAVTDAQGAFRFDGLLQSDAAGYALVEGPIPPAAGSFADGRVTVGSAGGTASGGDRVGAIVLGAGVQATGYLFGELPQAAVTGTVYLDRNRSGTLDAVPTDGRIAGVTVALHAGGSCAGTPVATATTDAAGSYTLAGGTAGLPYTVCETQPAGYGNGSASAGAGATVVDANAIAIAALPAGGSAGNHFGERAGSLAGVVFLDANNDGQRAAGDAGIAGVVVTLTGTDAAGGAVNRTATSDASGAWRFDDLLAAGAGGYAVTEQAAQPSVGGAVTLDGRTVAGTAGGTATAPGTTPSAVAGIALAAGADASGYAFAEIAAATLSGVVFADANDNGAFDAPADRGLAGVTVNLGGTDDLGAAVSRSTTTAADGTYSFTGLRPGTYTVTEPTQPAGTANGMTVAGSAGGTPTARATLPSAVGGIVLAPGAAATGYAFAELAAGASIAGSVYQDNGAGTPANAGNGVRDAGEAGIAGVTITLSGRDIAGAAVNLSAVTDAQGNFRFDSLLQSDAAGYALVQGAIPPAAGSFADGRVTVGSAGGTASGGDRVGAIVLGAGVQAAGYLFGELPQAAVTGTVYLDRNRSGTLDAVPTDGRIGGVTVTLHAGGSCTGAVVATTTTDAAGAYTLAGATAGLPYAVCETQPAGYGEGSVNPGAGATSPAANTITIGALPAGGSAGNHFGERAGSLAGSVFLDANNDGQRAAGDAGIAGVVVTLTGTDAAGGAVSRTATSDASGVWRFDDLLAAGAGSYAVTEQAAQPSVGGAATLDGRTVAGTAGGTATAPGTTPSAVSGIALAAGADASGYAFAELAPATLSGAVFVDANDNGARDAGEAGIAGVAIAVTGTDDLGAAVSRSVTTGADGGWSVTGLRPGTYAVTEPTQPAGTSNGATVAGSAGGTPTARTTTPSAVTGIVLAPGASASGYAFAESAASAVIAGRVGLDADNDGSIGAAETGIGGVTVELTGTTAGGDAVSRSAVSDAQGGFRFEGLLPGSYTVRLPAQPAGTLGGRASAGTSGGTPTAPGAAPASVGGIALAAGQTVTGLGFGALAPAGIAGRVFIDADGNGRADAGEPGLAGVTLRLAGTDDLGAAVAASAVTDAAGAYAFAGLRPGTYAVTEPDQPPGTTDGATRAGSAGGTATPVGTLPSAVSGIVLAPGTQSAGNDFAENGSSPDLLAAVASVEPRFTVGSTGTYTLRVRNAGSAPTGGAYTVTSRLPPGVVLDAAPAGAGWTCTGAAGAQGFACTAADALAPGATNPNPVTVRVRITAPALAASPASSAVLVEGGGEIAARAPSAAERDAFATNPGALPLCTAAIGQNACRSATPVQAAASVSGTVWLDAGASRGLLDGGDRRLAGWIVEVVDPAGGGVVARTTTAADGAWRIADLTPGVPLAVRFRDPQSGIVWAYPVNGETAPGSSGAACDPAAAQAGGGFSSCAAGGADASLGVVLAAGRDLPQQGLPVDPSVVYDAATRRAVAGATVTLAPLGTCPGWDPAAGVVGAALGGYSINGGAISMNAGADGRFQFVLSPAAPARCDFGLAVAPPSGYAFPSSLIPPAAGPFVPPGAPGGVYAVQPQADAPSGAAGVATTYHLAFAAGSALPRLVHNHLPLDAALPAGLSLQKAGDRAEAEIGDTVRYTVTVQRTAGAATAQTTVVDRLPAGFTYVPGTATVDGRPLADPAGRPGPRLTFELGAAPPSGQLVLQYRLRIGVGAQQGDGWNRARAFACAGPASCVGTDGATPLAGAVASNEGRHRVRISGGVFTTEACVLGKIFVDCNGNHVQDAEELGIPGVRLLFSDGTFLVSDAEGKYSYCGLPPRGHVLKVDAWTLPRGSRLTTTSNRNLGDAGSLWLDLKNGELHRADFAEGSCTNTVLDQVKARRAQGGVRSVETERPRGPALRFESKAHGLGAAGAPRQATDSADQPVPKPRGAGANPNGGATDAAR